MHHVDIQVKIFKPSSFEQILRSIKQHVSITMATMQGKIGLHDTQIGPPIYTCTLVRLLYFKKHCSFVLQLCSVIGDRIL